MPRSQRRGAHPTPTVAIEKSRRDDHRYGRRLPNLEIFDTRPSGFVQSAKAPPTLVQTLLRPNLGSFTTAQSNANPKRNVKNSIDETGAIQSYDRYRFFLRVHADFLSNPAISRQGSLNQIASTIYFLVPSILSSVESAVTRLEYCFQVFLKNYGKSVDKLAVDCNFSSGVIRIGKPNMLNVFRISEIFLRVRLATIVYSKSH
jgi:hypothetical protein